MDELKNSFEYEFVGELNYIKDGEPVQAQSITIKAPNNKLLREVSMIEQEYERSQIKLAKELVGSVIDRASMTDLIESRKESKPSDVPIKETAQDIVKNLMSGGADMDKCFSALRKILLSGRNENPVALVDNKEKMTNAIFEDMSFIDTKNILGEYIVNFTIASQAI